MPSIADNIALFVERMQAEARRAGRPPDELRLICVSKTFPAAAIREAYAAGQRAFGENYLQEALAKQQALQDLPLEWHFIGQIQSNKTAAIAGHFDWVHGVHRDRIARRLGAQRPARLAPLNVCLQVNISQETDKGGVAPDQDRVLDLARTVLDEPQLRLRGLMAVPAADPALARMQFQRMKTLFDALRVFAPGADTLSMGMSGDWPEALRHGANMIRIGRAIFGERTYDADRNA